MIDYSWILHKYKSLQIVYNIHAEITLGSAMMSAIPMCWEKSFFERGSANANQGDGEEVLALVRWPVAELDTDDRRTGADRSGPGG
ncbi:hypothetical protein [Geminicoccus flavidas]|uniref:hypothetical protein n=1 Tax=Geminicoccus flavidas TaxID=2506407 RepID=UPI001358137D|nr:hypothetical protein [Geminicoccus flavidas]